MRIELSRLHKELGTTMIYVTHDQVEAMTMGDRIAVFNKGRVEQLGAPMELYNQPANEFVATFLGAPRINLIDRPANSGAHPRIRLFGMRWRPLHPILRSGLRSGLSTSRWYRLARASRPPWCWLSILAMFPFCTCGLTALATCSMPRLRSGTKPSIRPARQLDSRQTPAGR